MLSLFAALFFYGYIVTPALTVYSWIRWSRSQRRRSRRVRLSLAGLALASAAIVLGIITVTLSSLRYHIFLHISPGLEPLYVFGIVLSAGSILVTLLGAFQDNPIRVKALLVALGALDLWFLAGSGQ